jgi:myosin heavy subunit
LHPPSAFIRAKSNRNGMSTTDTNKMQTDEQDDERRPTMSEFRALKERVAEVETENDRLRDRVDELEHRVDKNENSTDYAHDRIDESDDDHERANDQRKNLFSRVHDLETVVGSEDTVTASDTLGTDEGSDTASPLAQLTNLPEHVATEQLSANQQRARFVATDVLDYADTTPKGYVVDSATISKVLAVRDGESPHTETVSRTMDFLDGFGKSEVETRMHKGRRIAVFDAEAAKRYGNGTIDPSQCGVIRTRARG